MKTECALGMEAASFYGSPEASGAIKDIADSPAGGNAKKKSDLFSQIGFYMILGLLFSR
ncbi:hypothetical protein IRZ71_17985 [Flavobacterium sp. ANB]|uniref:hypothetical protein n=1 Tax=unclassified Flavobacterium TaxID=196869 RepID=UPI0012B70118|nr:MULTISPECIES: hypothetical protein [unclassified Flavobacterium]MBF4518251.1 hypothetical protein [Flavobacterium sp. ANB]MTD71051.1 hypothetical protein [Flavobacterium sp. LC2016-13]